MKTRSGNRQVILVVDDDTAVLKDLRSILNNGNYKVITAADGDKALQVIDERRPDMVISEVMMPSLGGYRLFKILQERCSTALIPFIFLTSRNSIADRIEGIRNGTYAYITKPFHEREVVALVDTVIRRHRIYVEQTLRDELTGLPNRKSLFQTLTNEHARARRYKRKLAIAMLDLDHFKRINDTYGHLIGDRVLIEVAVLIRKKVRRYDTVGRYGGEEFLIILPETDSAAATTLLNRLREKVAAMKWEEAEVEIQETLTFSAGVTDLSASDQKIEVLIERADCALYQAKKQGRNRLVVATRKE